MKHSVLNEMSSSNPSPQGSGIYVEKEARRLLESEVKKDGSKETVQHIKDLHRFKPDRVQH